MLLFVVDFDIFDLKKDGFLLVGVAGKVGGLDWISLRSNEKDDWSRSVERRSDVMKRNKQLEHNSKALKFILINIFIKTI